MWCVTCIMVASNSMPHFDVEETGTTQTVEMQEHVMRYLGSKMAFVLGLVVSVSATADEVPRGFADSGFIARAWQLHDWIVARAGYEPLDRLPTFLFVSTSELNYLALNETENGYSGETRSIEGVYASSIVFLREDFALGKDDDVLLHELVHHFQEMTGAEFTCVGESELQAYRLQARFVTETGIGTLPGDAFISFVSRC